MAVATVTIGNTNIGAFTASYSVEADCLIVGLVASSNVLLSRDQSDTWAGFVAGTLATPNKNQIAFARGTDKSPPNGDFPKIPLFRSEVIYLAFSATGSAIIYLEVPDA